MLPAHRFTWLTVTPPAPTGLVLFPFRADRGEAFLERYGYRTDVLIAVDDTEQRRQLVEIPRQAVRLPFVAMDERDAQLAAALIYDQQHDPYGVPLWQYATPLGAAVSPGATSITVDTTGVPHQVGGRVTLWRSAFSWEVLDVTSVGSGTLGTTPAAGSWAQAGTWVVPVVVARLVGDVDLVAASLRTGRAALEFSVDVVN